MTLTRVKKGHKNRRKEKEIETEEEEEGDERNNEPIQLESRTQEQQEIQRSLSPIWNVSPDVKETHQETTESLG